MNMLAKAGSRLRRTLSRLPIYAFYGVLKLIPERNLLGLFVHRFNITEIVVKGEEGVFGGSASDQDVIGRYAVERTWSPVFRKRFTGFLADNPGLTYLDIGANIGLTAIPVAAAGHRVIAFEPVPENYEHLLQNVRRNGVSDRMTVHNKALLDAKGTASFELSPSNHGDHRYRTDAAIDGMGENSWSVVEVAVDTLDEALAAIGGDFAVKMDTQGSEPLVIKGGAGVLGRTRMILCEFSPYQMNRMGTDSTLLVDYLAGFDRAEIYMCEDNEMSRSFSDGRALADFLTDYYRQWQSEPWGRYLNVLAVRD